MFSAVYLVCFVGSTCQFYIDSFSYESKEVCEQGALNNISRNLDEILAAGQEPPIVEYQCIGWDKA